MNRENRQFYKELFSLAIPIGLQNLLIALIGATDAFMLGRYSQDAVSAVSLANQASFIMNLFVGAAVGGGGVLLAQYYGKGDGGMVKNLFCMILKYAFGITVVFFCLAMFAPEALMRIYTKETALIEIGASYLRAVAPSYLFVGVTQCYYALMKLEGKAKKSIYISLFALIADVVLDIFLIYGLIGDFQGFGPDGSAYSTVFVEFCALVWCVAESYRKGSTRVDLKGVLWHSWAITKDFFKVLLPMLGSSLAWGIGFSLHSFIMGHLGSDATAPASIASVAQEVITCLCKGISAGAGIMVGKLLGQNLFEEAKAYGKRFWKVAIFTGLLHMAVLYALIPVFSAFFILSETAERYLVYMLLFNGLYAFAYSLNAIIVCGVFPAGGDANYDAVSVFLSSWCFALPLALLGAFVFDWSVIAVYILMCSDEIVKLPWLYGRYKKYKWLKNLTHDAPAA